MELVPLSKKASSFLGETETKARMKGGRAVKDDRRGGVPGLHKRGTSAEDGGGAAEVARLDP